MLAILCVVFTIGSNVMHIYSIEANPQTMSDRCQVFEYTNVSFTHGESPAWDAAAGTLYWVDVLNQNVHALHHATMRHRVKHIEYGEVNVVLPVAESGRLLVCVRSEIFLLDWDKPGDSALRLVTAVDAGKPDNVLNEGKADARGRFWGGTKGPQHGDAVLPDQGALYSLESPSFTPQVQLKPVSISNGVAWALNDSLMYYIDSHTMTIDVFDFDLHNGQISKRRTILDLAEHGFHGAIADGMTIDRDGFIWVALMFDGSVIRIDPNSRSIVQQYKLPVSRVSSVAWMGATLESLVVTTSRRNMDAGALAAEPLSGCIFILHCLGTGGVPDHKFVFKGADRY